MTSDLQVKHEVAQMWHERHVGIANSFLRGDMRSLASDYDMYFTYFTGRRYQPDRPEKKRLVLDWNGKWVHADKELPDVVEPSRRRSFFKACRSRKINASPFEATYPLRILAKMIEAHIDSRHAFTFYHTGAPDLDRKTKGRGSIIAVDVDNHDVNMPPQLRDIYIARAAVVFGRFFGSLLLATFRMPQLIHNDYRGGEGVKLEGNPLDLNDFRADYVNPSGHPHTSLLAKYAGAFFAYDALVRLDLVNDTRDALRRLLNGELDVAFLNAGDNVVFLGAGTLLGKIQASAPYCRFSHSETFQGSVAVKTSAGEVRWVPNIMSYFLNFFTPGRPIGHPQRGHWANGWLERSKVYSASPVYETAKLLANRVTREVLSVAIDDLAETRKSAGVVIGRSLVDSEFMIDPDIIYYKTRVEDISRDIFEQFYFVIEPKHYYKMYQRLKEMG
jgi:hypothetical protein